jgi:hypothetical protein
MLEATMVNDLVDPEVSYQATILADALRHLPRGSAARYVPMSEAKWGEQVLAEETLPVLFNDVLQMSLCSPISDVEKEMANIFSKTIVQRCMTRMMASVVLAMFEVKLRKNTKTHQMDVAYDGRRLESMAKHVFLTSLLGNFRHCKPSSRPTKATRHALYRMAYSDFGDQWFRNWLRFGAHLFVFAFRDYLVHALTDHPSMQHHFDQLIRFESFATCTMYAMEEARQVFELQTALLRDSLEVDSQSNTELYDLVAHKVNYWHDKMLKLSYQRCETSITAGLSAVRKVIPLTAVPSLTAQQEATTVDVLEGDEVDDAIQNALAKANNLSNYFVDSPSTDLHEDVATGTEVGGALLHHIKQYLSEAQLDALQQVVKRAALLRTGSFQQCIDFFPCFGIHPQNVHFIRHIINAMHCGTINKQFQLKMFQTLHAKTVHGYVLTHLTAELLRETKALAIVRLLPHHIQQNQVKALQERWGLTEVNALIYNTTVFQYCAVCGHIYSVLAEFRSQ